MEKTAYRLNDIIDAMTAIQTMSAPDFRAWLDHLQYELKLRAVISKRGTAHETYNQHRETWRPTFTRSEEDRYYNRAVELLKECFRHDHAFQRLTGHEQNEDHEDFKRRCEVLRNQKGQYLSLSGFNSYSVERSGDHEQGQQ